MDDQETLHRRARLRELIEKCFQGSQAALLRYIESRTNKIPNQGEMSAILKDHSGKSFGDKKAKALCEQIGLGRRWFDLPMGSNLAADKWLSDQGVIDTKHLVAVEQPAGGECLELWRRYNAASQEQRTIVDVTLDWKQPRDDRRDQVKAMIDAALLVVRASPLSSAGPSKKASS